MKKIILFVSLMSLCSCVEQKREETKEIHSYKIVNYFEETCHDGILYFINFGSTGQSISPVIDPVDRLPKKC